MRLSQCRPVTRDQWFTLAADRVRRGHLIRVFSGGEARWAAVEDVKKAGYSVTFTTNLGDYTYYRGTRMVLKQEN